jgi:hypothetical protein
MRWRSSISTCDRPAGQGSGRAARDSEAGATSAGATRQQTVRARRHDGYLGSGRCPEVNSDGCRAMVASQSFWQPSNRSSRRHIQSDRVRPTPDPLLRSVQSRAVGAPSTSITTGKPSTSSGSCSLSNPTFSIESVCTTNLRNPSRQTMPALQTLAPPT